MKYLIKHISCDISEDSWDNGLSTNTFHSYSYGINEIVNRKELLNRISNHIGKEIGIDDIDIIDGHINVSTLNSFKPNQDWDEFPIATQEEIELWKEGKMTLYCAQYSFTCHLISSFDVLI